MKKIDDLIEERRRSEAKKHKTQKQPERRSRPNREDADREIASIDMDKLCELFFETDLTDRLDLALTRMVRARINRLKPKIDDRAIYLHYEENEDWNDDGDHYYYYQSTEHDLLKKALGDILEPNRFLLFGMPQKQKTSWTILEALNIEQRLFGLARTHLGFRITIKDFWVKGSNPKIPLVECCFTRKLTKRFIEIERRIHSEFNETITD